MILKEEARMSLNYKSLVISELSLRRLLKNSSMNTLIIALTHTPHNDNQIQRLAKTIEKAECLMRLLVNHLFWRI